MYDAFILEEEEKLNEKIFGEYYGLDLSNVPRITSASDENEAESLLKVKYFDFKVNQKSFTGKKYSNLEDDFYKDAVDLLDKMLANKKQVRLLGIKFSEFISGDDSMQENLFQDIDKKENLMKKIDKIRKKYDYDIVKFGRTFEL